MNRLDIEKHSNNYEKLLNRIVKNARLNANSVYVKNIEYKLKQYENILNKFKVFPNKGSVLVEYLDFINNSYVEVKNLLANIDDKFLLFVVGMGKYGKSTLINALIQEKVAPIDFRPKTWKIDVYYLDEKHTGDVIIKLNDGNVLKLNREEAQTFIDQEESKVQDSIKLFNKVKNVEFKKCKTKEEREEMKKKLQDEYLYKSKVIEVRWPVENNKFLRNMLLVDTPGLIQDNADLNNSIKDYYFKADGVIWMLDGSTISSKSNDEMVKELEDYLEDLGGINDNIIGVVNKIDKVFENGGEKAIYDVLNDAKSFFGDKFKYIVPISAKEAFENENDKNLLNLNEKIEDAFLSDSNALKLESKAKGVQKLINDSIQKNNEFLDFVSEKNREYYERKNYIEKFKKDLKNEISSELEDLVEKYIKKVYSNIEIKAKNLFDIRDPGESKSYVVNDIFNLNSFQSQLDSFLDIKSDLIDIEAERIYEYCTLSKYKYISNIIKENSLVILENKNLNLQVKQNFNIYTSLGDFNGDGIFDFLGGLINQLYKGVVKLFRMNPVKVNLRSTINKIAESAKNDIYNLLNSKIEKVVKNSQDILDKSYENILFEQSKFKNVQEYINQFNEDVLKEFEVKLQDVFY